MIYYRRKTLRDVRVYTHLRAEDTFGKVYWWCHQMGDYRWLWETAAGVNTRSYLMLNAALRDPRIAKDAKRNFIHTMRYLRTRVGGIRRHP